MIPKTIHYIWLSGEEFPESIKMVMEINKQKLPDYKVRIWTSDDYNQIPDKPQYIIDAYNQRKWAFVSDFMRVYALYKEGGWYLDTDLQIIRNDLDKYSNHQVVSAVENSGSKMEIQAAFIGGIQNHIFFKDILDYYHSLSFDFNDTHTLLAPKIYSIVAEKYGYVYKDVEQNLPNDVLILESKYVLAHRNHCRCPRIPFAIHHCFHGWANEQWGIQKDSIMYFSDINSDKWIIQTFYTKNIKKDRMILEHYLTSYTLSLFYAKRSGYKVKLYTDNFGYDVLKSLKYDDVSISLDNIPNKLSNINSIDKIYTLKDFGIGGVYIDCFSLLLKPFAISKFYVDKSIDAIIYSDTSETNIIGFNNQQLLDKYISKCSLPENIKDYNIEYVIDKDNYIKTVSYKRISKKGCD